MSDITLFFSPQPTRSARARWAFLEAGVPFEGREVDVFQGQQSEPAYLAVNPMGYVPAATVDGVPMIESSALALWAAMTYPEAGLLPEEGAQRRACLQWVVFGPAEMDRRLDVLNQHTRFLPLDQRDEAEAERQRQLFARRARLVTDALGEGPFLLGSSLTVADCVVGHDVAWAKMLGLLDEQPVLQAYLDRLQQRPAFQQVYGPKVSLFPDPHAVA
ncbi:MAG: glutathione S-transferase family protein [Myxococcales bacterium]|nr:glutathione S-transferase family protein [Myxococcales bacterium]